MQQIDRDPRTEDRGPHMLFASIQKVMMTTERIIEDIVYHSFSLSKLTNACVCCLQFMIICYTELKIDNTVTLHRSSTIL